MLPRIQCLWVRDPAASSDRLDNTCMALGRRRGTGAGVSQKRQVPESGGGRSSRDSNSPWKRASAVSLPGREAEVLVIQSGLGSPRARGCGVEDDARGRTPGTFLRLRAAAAAAAAASAAPAAPAAPKVYTASSPIGLHHLLQTSSCGWPTSPPVTALPSDPSASLPSSHILRGLLEQGGAKSAVLCGNLFLFLLRGGRTVGSL